MVNKIRRYASDTNSLLIIIVVKWSWEQPCNAGAMNISPVLVRHNEWPREWMTDSRSRHSVPLSFRLLLGCGIIAVSKAKGKEGNELFLLCYSPKITTQQPLFSLLCWQESKLALERGIVNMHIFNPPYPAVRPGCVPQNSIIVCNEKLE